jgi:hypothetical protein
MKKYFMTSVLSLFLIVGTGLVLTATEKKESSGCCSSKTAEAVQTSASDCSGTAKAEKAAASCGDKETKAEATSGDVQVIQASNVEKSGCTSAAAASECTGSSTIKATSAESGDCKKVPSGVSGQRASREL